MAAAGGAVAPKNSPFALGEKSSNAQKIASKSDPNALCKTLIILLLVLVIPLFPSQAPDFITQTLLNEFWEIIHLVFIGIAVAYGLFCRRTARIEKFVDSRTDDNHSYLSGISQLNSIFDDGYENVGYEHDMKHNYLNCGDEILGKDGCVVNSGGKKIRSFVPNGGNESLSLNGNQVLYSQYSKGDSLVVVSNGKYFLDSSSDFKPLNLPIRSLRSRALDSDKLEFKNRDGEFSSRFEAKGDDDDAKVVKIRGVMPMNLEKKFEEVAGHSRIPWRSRSLQMENGEEIGNSNPPAHSRPHSIGEFEFSKSLQGSKLSASPEVERSKMDSLERKRVFSASHTKVARVDSEASSSTSGSLDMDSSGDLESILKNADVEEEMRKAGQVSESLESSDANSSSIGKAKSRAKSVRTTKPKRYIVNHKEESPNRGASKFGRVFIKSKEDILIKRREEESEYPQVDHHKEDSVRAFAMPKPKPTISELHNEEKQNLDERNTTRSENSRIGVDKSSDEDEDARTNIETDGEFGSEVDRKAGEFIAKFREQIRLQKTTSSVAGND